MREMIDSGIEWIGCIPQDWGIIPFKRAFVARDGGAWGVEPKNDENDFICIRIADFDYSRMTIKHDTEYTIRNYESAVISRLILKKGDILVEKSGGGENTPVGRSIIFNEEFPALYANFMDRLRTKQTFSAKYIQYIFVTFYANGYSKIYIKQTTGIQNLNLTSLLSNENIALPILKEQQAIADYLDRKCALIDCTIEKQKVVIEKLKLYKQSVITEAVTKGLDRNAKMKPSGIEWIGDIPKEWEVRKLKDIGDAIIGLTYSPTDVSDSGTLVLRSSNVKDGKILLEDNVYVDTAIKDKLIVKPGDILICSRNGSKALIGKCAFIDEITSGHSFGAFMTVYRSSHNRFVFYVLNSAIFSFHLATFLTSTINQLTTGNLNGIAIPLPTTIEQKSIADYLDKKCAEIDNAIKNKQKVIDKLNDYKKSIIYEIVTGKVEV